MRTLLRTLLLSTCALAVACGGDEPTEDIDGGDVAADGSDVGDDTTDDADPPDTTDAGPDIPPGDVAPDTGPLSPEDVICTECETNAECGPAGNLCLNFPDGSTFCGWDCTGNDAICPVGTICAEVTADVSQCVPADFECLDPCLGIECPDGQVCDPSTTECIEPRGLCETCENNGQCGTAADLCLTFQDIDRSQGCSLDCSADPNVCPEDYGCATINAPTGPLQQCVPTIGTCIDRCIDVNCEVEGDLCNPRTGECSPPGVVCSPCINDSECGGDEDRCLGLSGPTCEEDIDCSIDEFCNDEGVCVGGFCGEDCSIDPTICPEGAACFNLTDGGAQCLPLRLACVDRCAGVECEDGANCDDQTGECVDVQVGACGTPCDTHAECGTYNDLCLGIGTGGQQCYVQCGDAIDPCPIGYDCFGGVIAGLDFCLPNTSGLECGDCLTMSCPDGTECRPPSGECIDLPDSCSFDEDLCEEGTLCNTFEDRCEPIGLDCTFEDRFFQCDFGSMSCTSPTPGVEGQCEESCFGAECPLDRPECTSYHGVSGRVCVSDPVGGAHTCARLMSTFTSIGRPCTVIDDPTDPSICFAPTNYCLEGADPDVPGFCTHDCLDDSECPSGSVCGSIGDGQYCVPDPCECMLPIALGDGEVDIFGGLLSAAGATRCALSWELRERRLAYSVVEVDDAYRLPAVGTVLGDPQQSMTFLDAEVRAATDGTLGSALSLAGAAYGEAPGLSTAPADREGDNPLFDALVDLEASLGGTAPATSVLDAAALLPMELQIATARVLDGLADGLRVIRGRIDLIPVAQRALVFNELHATLYAGETELSLSDPELRAIVANSTILQGFLRGAGTIGVAVESFPRDPEADLSGVDFRYESSVGVVRIADDSNDVHEDTAPHLLLIDLGGDDQYNAPVGSNAGPAFPVSVAIDLGGADTYSYTTVSDPEDGSAYPSDGAGRAEPVRLGDGPVTLSTIGRHGSGRMGVGMLFDWGAGHDVFESLRFSQGFGLMGVGVLVDDGDTASFRVESLGQGAGLFGVGILIAGDAAHTYEGMSGVQGFGGVHGVGILAERGGDDVYTATAGSAAAGTVLYFNKLSNNDFNFSAAQGAGVGTSAARSADGRSASGGLGVLADLAGADTYSAGVGAQGFGHWHGVGMHRDYDGADTYGGRSLVGGAASEFGVGSHIDSAGDDDYGTAEVRPALSFGYGSDFGGGIFGDFAGSDDYFSGQSSLGFGRLNGVALFIEQDGDDSYDSTSNDSLGRAVLTIFGSEPSDNLRRQAGTYGFFVDAGGFDTYERPDLLTPVIGDGLEWLQTSPDEEDLPTFGGGVDEIGATGFGE